MEGERKDLDMRPTVERETGRRRKTRREEVEGDSTTRRKKKKMPVMEDQETWSWAGHKKKTILLRQNRKFKVINKIDKEYSRCGALTVPAFAIIKVKRDSMKASPYDKNFESDYDDDDDGTPLVKMLPYPCLQHFSYGLTCAVWKSRLFFISGRPFGGYPCTPNVVSFDTKSKEWKTLSPIPTPRTGHMAVVVKHRIYVFGGACFPMHGITEDDWGQRYNIKKNTWKNLPTTPSLVYQLLTPRAFAVYYNCQAFTYSTKQRTKHRTKHRNPHQVSKNQNLILFPLPRQSYYRFLVSAPVSAPNSVFNCISVFNCSENKWLPDLFPDLPEDAPPFFPLCAPTLQNRLAVIDGVLLWHHSGTIYGYDFLESKYLPELHTLPPNTGYESDQPYHHPMFLVHPGGANKLYLIFQSVDYIVQCHVLLIQLRQQGRPGPRLSLHFHSHSSLSTKFMKQTTLEDVLLI